MKLLRQLFSFGSIGVCATLTDAAVFTLVNLVFQNPYLSRVVSYLIAASTSWFLNRRFTFGASERSPVAEWGRFLTLQLGGGIVNYGVFALLISTTQVFSAYPVAAIAVGAVFGAGVNFTTARFFVFDRSEDER